MSINHIIIPIIREDDLLKAHPLLREYHYLIPSDVREGVITWYSGKYLSETRIIPTCFKEDRVGAKIGVIYCEESSWEEVLDRLKYNWSPIAYETANLASVFTGEKLREWTPEEASDDDDEE